MENGISQKVGSSRNNRELIPEKVGNGYPEKVGNTKETITKEKINNEFTNVNSVQQPETSLPKKQNLSRSIIKE